MTLDLTAILGNLALDDEGKATTSPIQPLEDKAPAEVPPSPSQGSDSPTQFQDTAPCIFPLVKRREEELQEVERARDVYGRYQQNIKAVGTMRAEILQGVRAGKPIEPLFLKACKMISSMTAEPLFAEQVEHDLVTIYGKGQGAAAVLQAEAEQVQDRLDRMLQALESVTEPGDRKRLEAAIEAHRNRLQELRGDNRR